MLLDTAAPATQSPNYTMYIILALVLVGLWFMSRRSRKTQQQAMEFRNNLKPGDEVMTGSGLFGTIVEVDGDAITIESTPGVRTVWLRAAVAKLATPPVAVAAIADVDEDDEEYDEEYEGEYDEDDDLDEDIEVPDDLSSLDATPDEKPEDTDQK